MRNICECPTCRHNVHRISNAVFQSLAFDLAQDAIRNADTLTLRTDVSEIAAVSGSLLTGLDVTTKK